MRYHSATWPPRTALITGAASGIGRALALSLAQHGTSIAAIDRDSDGLKHLESESGRRNGIVGCQVVDVTDATGLRDAVCALEARLGPADLLIACAGTCVQTPALDLKPSDMAAVIQVNLLGVCNTIAAVLPGMLQRRGGHIAAVSSLASLHGLPGTLAYCASKAGVNALLDGLRLEVKPFGIAVTTICPGWVRTPLTATVKGPMPSLMEPEEAARRILHALRRRRPFHAFPFSWAWRMRFLNWLPSRLGDWLIEQTLKRRGPLGRFTPSEGAQSPA